MNNEYQSNRGQTAGVIGLVLSIVAIVLAFVPCIGMFAVVPGCFGLVFGTVSLVMAANRNAPKGLAIGGLALALVAIIVSSVWLIGLRHEGWIENLLERGVSPGVKRSVIRVLDDLDDVDNLDDADGQDDTILDFEVQEDDGEATLRLHMRSKKLEEQLRMLDTLDGEVSIRDSAGVTQIVIKGKHR